MQVHRDWGWGFQERVYRECLAAQFRRRGIPYEKEVPFALRYLDVDLPNAYRADFVCFGEVLVELKATDGLGEHDVIQVVNYLRLASLERGLLFNFGQQALQTKRVLNTGLAKIDSAHTRRAS